MKVLSINKKLCLGCGTCTVICEDAFEVRNGKAIVKKGKEKLKVPCAGAAAESCPVKAIKFK